MKPAEFDYLRADTVDEALAALAEHGDEARVLAGGQSLMPILNMRLARPGIVIDVARIADGRYVQERDGMVEVGAATTQAELETWPALAARLPLVAQALPHIGHMQTRSRGTVCGSLSHADPSSELPLCLAVLEGEVVLRSRAKRRVMAASDFQTGMLTTAKRADEMVVAARFPTAKPGAGYAFREVARRHGDFAIVALAAVAEGERIRFGVGGVAERPHVREWQALAPADVTEALNAFAWELGGYDDIHASARYRRELVRRIGARVIEEARSCRS